MKTSWKKFCGDPEVVGAKKNGNRNASKTCYKDIKDTFEALDSAGHLPKIVCDSSEIINLPGLKPGEDNAAVIVVKVKKMEEMMSDMMTANLLMKEQLDLIQKQLGGSPAAATAGKVATTSLHCRVSRRSCSVLHTTVAGYCACADILE